MDYEMIFRVSQAIRATPNASDYDTLVAINAIKAMREPTEKMVGAIIKKNGFLPNGRFWADVWNDGIDAVIND